MEIQKIQILPGQDVESEFGAEIVQCWFRSRLGFAFWIFVQPNALNLIPNFDFGEDINPILGSLKNSSSVKSPNFWQ